jgi:hypothetical protein
LASLPVAFRTSSFCSGVRVILMLGRVVMARSCEWSLRTRDNLATYREDTVKSPLPLREFDITL